MELIDFPTLLIQSVNLAIIFFVLWRFVFRPYLAFLDTETADRQALAHKLAEQDALISQAKSEADALVESARTEARTLSTDIVENAKKEAQDLLTKAQAEAQVMREQGFSDIASERKSMELEMRDRVIDVALALNAKIFGDSKIHREFLEAQSGEVKF